ncbi:hypothetical protein [Aliarcobacter butzleri]|uniref:Uncharacterized protein n=1 Tax=Aliarcobacter butzleri L351 TaxID=1447259 RepID=A0A837J6Y4_9BACT|nr:hypothetical protein [Aliarcobacter butzleri]KLE01483.1 hypothetical protein AF76_04945 [Aliarcobacter butzleri L351]KLE13236.1 hypothetical protein AF75_05080 [Aliarcobacter butzleri L350]MDN5046980.1 hypothetical protein [Aliarcobacter butzleri]MDN5058850.1 hypothetical protein [Aliarcobacter butzleri]MDN5109720.1 hypothetical protein [Aliarcobacter butzleri]
MQYQTILKALILFNLLTLFVGCSYKIDNTSKKESYKTLESISSLNVEKKDITIINGANYSVHYVNWGNGVGMSPVFNFNQPLISNKSCKTISQINIDEITSNLSELTQLFKNKNIIIENKSKKTLLITPEKYDCDNDFLYIKVTLLEEEELIYQNLFILDRYYNTVVFSYLFTKYSFSKDSKKDINKFFKVLIQDLEKTINFSSTK